MAIWKSVEYIEVSITAATEGTAVNLSKSQDETQCVPFFSQRSTESTVDQTQDQMAEVTFLDNGGTPAVKVSASARVETGAHIFQIFVVEFDPSINVQQLTVSDFTNTVTSTTKACTSVGAATSEAFCIYSYQYTDPQASDDDWNDAFVQVKFNSTTEVSLARRAGEGACNGTLYVVDCDSAEWTVYHHEEDITTTSNADTTATIDGSPTVVTADTFIIHSYETSEPADDMLDGAWIAELASTTQIRLRRGDDSPSGQDQTSTHSIAIVECNNNEWDVQRENELVLATATQSGAAITAINETRSFIVVNNHASQPKSVGRRDGATGGDIDDLQCAAHFVDTTHAQFRFRVATRTNVRIGYEVVQFAEAAAPAGGPNLLTLLGVG